MERLTEKHYGKDGYYMKCSEDCANDDEMCGGCPYLDKIIDRLGAYEDTGLTQEQVAALKEEKPIEAFLHPIDAYEGLKEKYLVFKADTGEKVRNCFVLRPDKDPAAIVALRAYAETTDNENLAGDIYNWVGKDNNVPCKWIPVSERLPDRQMECVCRYRFRDGDQYFHQVLTYFARDTVPHFQHEMGGCRLQVTHWMPLPAAPEVK